jgi:tetratricopeptide (TPR) repeat protein
MKAFKSAEITYKKAIELNKYIPESYNKLADYYKAVGDGAKVEATYKLGIETIKESMESDTLVLDAYAEWLAGEKRYDEAIKIYEQLIVKQPGNKAAIERKIEGLRK